MAREGLSGSMMLQKILGRVLNWLKATFGLAAAIGAVWRGNDYTNSHPGVTAPLMCMLFAIAVGMTVLAMAIPPGEG